MYFFLQFYQYLLHWTDSFFQTFTLWFMLSLIPYFSKKSGVFILLRSAPTNASAIMKYNSLERVSQTSSGAVGWASRVNCLTSCPSCGMVSLTFCLLFMNWALYSSVWLAVEKLSSRAFDSVFIFICNVSRGFPSTPWAWPLRETARYIPFSVSDQTNGSTKYKN